MKHFYVFILIAILIMGAYVGTTNRLEQATIRDHERAFNQEQARQVAAAAANLENYFRGVKNIFDSLALYAVPAYFSDDLPLPILQQIIAASALSLYMDRAAIGFFPAADTALALYTTPVGVGPVAQEMLFTWMAERWEPVRLSKSAMVTPFAVTQDYQLFGYLSPVFHPESGEFVGVVGAALNFAPVLAHNIAPLRSGRYGAAWVQDRAGLVIYDHELPTVGDNVIRISATYPDLRRVVEEMFVQDTGQDEYHYTVELGGRVERKLVAWDTVYMGSQRLTIAMSAPDTEVNAELTVFRQQTLLLGGLLAAALLASGGLFYVLRQRTLKRLVASRTQALEQTTRDLQALAAHLEQRVRSRTEELNLERAQLAAILDVIDDGLIYHQAGKIKYINAAFARQLGFTAEEMVNQSAEFQRQVVSSPEEYEYARQRYWQHIHTRDEHKPAWQIEIRMRRKDGSEFDARVTSMPIFDDQGRYVGGVEIIRNVSQEKALQIQRDNFITNASHELRRPLANLKTRIYLLRRQPEKLEMHLEVIDRATDMMAHLVQALVDMAQLQRGEFRLERKPVSLQTALRQALEYAQVEASSQQIALVGDLPDTPVFVYADYQWLVEGFKRLLTGVIPYTRPGGQIQVQLAARSNNGSETGLAVVTVRGATPHLESEYLEHIFEPFARASEGDTHYTGLELAIAQHVFEAHSGQITARSDPQHGLMFTVQLTSYSPN